MTPLALRRPGGGWRSKHMHVARTAIKPRAHRGLSVALWRTALALHGAAHLRSTALHGAALHGAALHAAALHSAALHIAAPAAHSSRHAYVGVRTGTSVCRSCVDDRDDSLSARRRGCRRVGLVLWSARQRFTWA